ncbi:SDR family NAD(P)-dependent oxidoreductase [Fictibacillus phosphorivorans]|uniref:SDR family NAD(P)-dependent oxidoreductase n=1 Tax=Fictibacillus phosphorivorans TaxID=1221500 RepID=UPI00203E8A6C|nr:SDR family oxidoreductase [Fictibacillus phosphorivorans]MCM3719977.1 SDR family oxidoreductase [Fictibacillus phosphorivorans]MCM3777666.1 SDR family oxidoreductase [Fictibacillus phosphorivorans]
MNLELEGKSVLITGGSKGIGQAIAYAFLEEGAKVGIVGRTSSDLESAQKEGIEIFQGDVTVETDRKRVMKDFLKKFGTIDVLVNNAGGSNGSTVMDTSLEQFEEALHLNFLSAVDLSKQAAEVMSGNTEGGAIINISSIFGRESGGKPTYNASKAAMISFTKSFGDEIIKKGVRVNGVAPGSILHETGNWKKRLEQDPEKINAFVQEHISAGRFGTVEEVANVVLFLASKRASWVVGSTLNVDGGQSYSNF